MNYQDKTLRLALIEHSNIYAGGQAVYIQTAKALLDKAFKIILVYPKGGDLSTYIETQISAGVESLTYKAFKYRNGRKNLFDFIKQLTSIVTFLPVALKIRNYDKWYVNGGRVLIPCLFYAIIFKKSLIYHAHIVHSSLLVHVISIFCKLGIIENIVFPSQFLFNNFYKITHIFLRYGVVIPNCLPNSLANLTFTDKFKNKPFNVAVIGTVCSAKGQHVIVNILKKEKLFNLHIIGSPLMGEENYYKELKSSCVDVVFASKFQSISQEIDKFSINIVLVPTIVEEAFGLVAVESMACSCIVIAHNVGGLSEIAKSTSMITYDNESELFDILKSLHTMNCHELVMVAKSQQSKARFEYHPNNYALKIQALLKSNVRSN